MMASPGSTGSSGSSLWRHSDFLKLWTGESISLLGSQITFLALPLTAVTWLQATPFEMGLLGALEFAPFLLFSLVAGVWADRLPRRPILMAANIGRALLLGSIPLMALNGWLGMGYLYVMAFGVGVLTVFFDVAYQSYLPVLVTREQLVEGNSKLEGSSSVAQIAGPALAGGLVQAFTAPIAVAADAASFLVSAFCLGLIRRREIPGNRAGKWEPIWGEIREGLDVVFHSPILRSIAGCTATNNFFSNVRFAVLTIYVVRELGIEPGLLGIIFAVGSVGALIGALWGSAIARRWGVGPTLISAALVGAMGSLALPAAQGSITFAVAMLILGLFINGGANPVYNITQMSLRQSIIPLRLQGRMNASMRFLVWGTIPLGSLTGGALGEVIGIHTTLVIGAIGGLLAVIWVYFSPVRNLIQPPPTDLEDEPSL
jgi:MFS family permease